MRRAIEAVHLEWKGVAGDRASLTAAEVFIAEIRGRITELAFVVASPAPDAVVRQQRATEVRAHRRLDNALAAIARLATFGDVRLRIAARQHAETRQSD